MVFLQKKLLYKVKVVFYFLLYAATTNLVLTPGPDILLKANEFESEGDSLFSQAASRIAEGYLQALTLNSLAVEKYDKAILIYKTLQQFAEAKVVAIKIAAHYELFGSNQIIPRIHRAESYRKAGIFFSQAKKKKKAREMYSSSIELFDNIELFSLASEVQELKDELRSSKRKCMELENCAICQYEMDIDNNEEGQTIFRSLCNHSFHASCWKDYVASKRVAGETKIKCPLCNLLAAKIKDRKSLRRRRARIVEEQHFAQDEEDTALALSLQERFYSEDISEAGEGESDQSMDLNLISR